MIKGQGWSNIWFDVLILFVFIIVFTTMNIIGLNDIEKSNMTLILKFYPSMNGIFMPFLSNFIQNRYIIESNGYSDYVIIKLLISKIIHRERSFC